MPGGCENGVWFKVQVADMAEPYAVKCEREHYGNNVRGPRKEGFEHIEWKLARCQEPKIAKFRYIEEDEVDA
ncbi:hypothetical protein PMZ80_010419 [Knufia obscura]|uniref:Uncharacterized protein n=1 Tax=Knufia obscura TaxID=1635080 RepID=A0ABR0R9W4_9EURO|nr:hypothetical protein PMZ80_010419 [Knufia obscura]